jgi:transaldolase
MESLQILLLLKGVVVTLLKSSKKFPILSPSQSISAEVVADTAEEMVDQAQAFNGLWNVTIKVPCTVEGLKACTALAVNNYKVNVTLVFSVAQAILAEKAGASYVSPFVGRWMDNSVDGIGLIKNIRRHILVKDVSPPHRSLELPSVMFVR